jgi:hypothetical protein
LILKEKASNAHENRGFFAFRPVCPFRPVEPISTFYGQDGQEDFARGRTIDEIKPAAFNR